MAARTFTFLHIGVVFDVLRHASFLSDVMAIRYRVPDTELYMEALGKLFLFLHSFAML